MKLQGFCNEIERQLIFKFKIIDSNIQILQILIIDYLIPFVIVCSLPHKYHLLWLDRLSINEVAHIISIQNI